jgi:hypothetical protein
MYQNFAPTDQTKYNNKSYIRQQNSRNVKVEIPSSLNQSVSALQRVLNANPKFETAATWYITVDNSTFDLVYNQYNCIIVATNVTGVVINLPALADVITGYKLSFKSGSAGSATVYASEGDTIDGETNQTVSDGDTLSLVALQEQGFWSVM